MNALLPRFTLEDADRAYGEWGANCGPGALAAMLGLTLDEAKPHMWESGFDEKRYTSPSMMDAALRSTGKSWTKIGALWPKWGLVRIQWEGPWTEPGVPVRARYRYTHWVGAMTRADGAIGVFDINCMSNGTGWAALADWSNILVPWITKQIPRANGGWHITHAIEVTP